MRFEKSKKAIATYSKLNFIVSEAIDRHRNGLLTEEEYNEIILNIEMEMKKTEKTKEGIPFKDFLLRIIS
ncbi:MULTISPECIES: hypothetical protein [Flavobacterium]|uniref:Uncharacterized protein n=1 Tax=Flavobacterium jumunjinense TaxID=998845 RepID=A0ABV5GR67_9FLAO|nr:MULTISPECIES: hypothetical protein [Flavobacterium]